LDFIGIGTVLDFIKRTVFDQTVTDLAFTNAHFKGRLCMKDKDTIEWKKKKDKIYQKRKGLENGGGGLTGVENRGFVPDSNDEDYLNKNTSH
jgi:hypothetical protein